MSLEEAISKLAEEIIEYYNYDYNDNRGHVYVVNDVETLIYEHLFDRDTKLKNFSSKASGSKKEKSKRKKEKKEKIEKLVEK